MVQLSIPGGILWYTFIFALASNWHYFNCRRLWRHLWLVFTHKKRGPMKARQNCNLTFGRSTTGEVAPSWSPSPCWWFLTSGCALVGGLSHDSAFGWIQSCPLHHDRGKKHWIMESMKANHLLSDHGCCPKPPVWEKPTHETSTGTGVHRHA